MTHMRDNYTQPDPPVTAEINLIGTDDAVAAEIEVEIDYFEAYKVKAVSRRDEKDNPNNEIGAKLALGRAFRQLGRELLKEAQGMVREAEYQRRADQARVAELRRHKDAQRKRIASERTTVLD